MTDIGATVRQAARVLADHTFSYSSMDHGEHCSCGATGPDHSTHLAEVLHRAGLLADGPPPETPTRRADLDRLIDRYVAVSELARAGIAPEGMRVEERRRAWAHLGYSPDQIDLMEQALTDGPPPETPTARVRDHTCGGVEALMSECAACAPQETPITRVLAERADRRTT